MAAAVPASDPDWPTWLAREDVPLDTMVARLAKYVTAQGTLPPNCEFLWTELARLTSGGQAATALLPHLIETLDPRVAAQWLRTAPEHQVRSLFSDLVFATSLDPSLTPALTAIVRLLDEERLGDFAKCLGPLTAMYPADEPLLSKRLVILLKKLPEQASRFTQRLTILRSCARWLPPQGNERIPPWRQFQEAFEQFVRVCQQKTSLLTAAAVQAERETAAQRLVADLVQAMPADWYPDDKSASVKRRLLCGLIAAANLPVGALPKDFEQKVAGYFQTGRWAVPPPTPQPPPMPQPRPQPVPQSGAAPVEAGTPIPSTPTGDISSTWWKIPVAIGMGALVCLLGLMTYHGLFRGRGEIAGSGTTPMVSKPADSPTAQPGAGKPAAPPDAKTEESGAAGATKLPSGAAKQVPPPVAARKDGTAGKEAEAAGPPKTGAGTSTEGSAPTETVEEPEAGSKDARPEPAELQDQPSKETLQTSPPAQPKVEFPPLEATSEIQVLAAMKPLDNAFEGSGPGPFAILQGLDPEEVPVRLHGTKLAEAVQLSSGSRPGAFGPDAYREFDRIETECKKNTLQLAVRFKGMKIEPYSLTTLESKADGTLSCRVDDTALLKDDFEPRHRLQQEVLRFCVVELRQEAEQPPRLVALVKPATASFELDSSGGAHIQDSTNPLRPGPPPWNQLYLGQGKISHADGEFEFGRSWMQQDPCGKWPVPELSQALGTPHEVTIELQATGDRVRLALRAPEPETDVRDPKGRKAELDRVKDQKKKLENLVRVVSRARNPADVAKAVRSLAAEVQLADSGPGLPSPPALVTPPSGRDWAGGAIAPSDVVVRNFQLENQRRVAVYQIQIQAFGDWVRQVVVPAGETKIEDLEQQIKQIEEGSSRLVEQGNGGKGLKNWLRSGVEVYAYIYRLVPYDGPGQPRQIRVLVVEPGASGATPGVPLGTNSL